MSGTTRSCLLFVCYLVMGEGIHICAPYTKAMQMYLFHVAAALLPKTDPVNNLSHCFSQKVPKSKRKVVDFTEVTLIL